MNEITKVNSPILEQIQKRLAKYFSYFKAPNILAVSEDKIQLPFMFLIFDEGHTNCVLLSIAVDYPNAINIAHVTLIVRQLAEAMLTHAFYISTTNGHTYIDDDAYHRWDLEAIPLENFEPTSEHKH